MAYRLQQARRSCPGFRPNTGRAKMVSNSQGEPVIAASRVRTLDSALVQAVESARLGSVETTVHLIQSARRSLQESLPGEMQPLRSFEIMAGLRRPRPVRASAKAPF